MERLIHHDRYAYSPITERPDFDWPEGRRVALYLALNIEVFAFGSGVGPTLDGAKPAPDVQNHGWRDYGNRVGIWRMLELLDDLGWPATVLPNAAVYDEAPQIMDAVRERGYEIAAHGITNSEKQGGLSPHMEAALIRETTDVFERHEGRRPEGWLGPHISQSAQTPDLLAAAGYSYMMDWPIDDQPVWMRTDEGPLLSVPYPQEMNDVPMVVGRGHEGALFADMIRDTLAVHLAEAGRRPSVMGIALHPYLMGQPHRFYHLAGVLREMTEACEDRVWITTAGGIARHYADAFPPPV